MNTIIELTKTLEKVTGLQATDVHIVFQKNEDMYVGEVKLEDATINFTKNYFIYEDGTIESAK